MATLIAHYNCGEASGALIDSVGGANFSASGWGSVAGKVGNARRKTAEGNFFWRPAHSAFAFRSHRRTILAWVKIGSTLAPPSSYQTILSQEDALFVSPPQTTFGVQDGDGDGVIDEFELDLHEDGSWIPSIQMPVPRPISAGIWYFVAIQVDDIDKWASLRVAADGDTTIRTAPGNFAAWSGSLQASSNPVVIGADSVSSGSPIGGFLSAVSAIDEIYVFDGLLSESEIDVFLQGDESSSSSFESYSSSSSSLDYSTSSNPSDSGDNSSLSSLSSPSSPSSSLSSQSSASSLSSPSSASSASSQSSDSSSSTERLLSSQSSQSSSSSSTEASETSSSSSLRFSSFSSLSSNSSSSTEQSLTSSSSSSTALSYSSSSSSESSLGTSLSSLSSLSSSSGGTSSSSSSSSHSSSSTEQSETSSSSDSSGGVSSSSSSSTEASDSSSSSSVSSLSSESSESSESSLSSSSPSSQSSSSSSPSSLSSSSTEQSLTSSSSSSTEASFTSSVSSLSSASSQSSSSSIGHSSSSSSTSESYSSSSSYSSQSNSSQSSSSSESSASSESSSSSSSSQSGGDDTEIVAGQSLVIPNRYGVRRMAIGANWTVLNLGIRFRQKRAGVPPSTLSGRRIGFGLCSGLEDVQRHFIGVRSSTSWTRSGYWWGMAGELFTSISGSETLYESGSGTVRISADDEFASAWYCRFTKGLSEMRIDMFLPGAPNSPNDFDFDTQLNREKWNPCVNNHGSYVEVSAVLPADETTHGAFDCVNIFSNIDGFDTEALRAVEWLDVKAVRIE